MMLKILVNRFKKTFLKQHKDYTLTIYILRVVSFLFTWLFFIFYFFDREKRIKFHSEKNILYKKYLEIMNINNQKLNAEFNAKFLRGDSYNFNGIFLPKVEDVTTLRFIYEDVLSIYTEKNDDYDYKIVDLVEKKTTEGPFCYIGKDGEDITIHKGDVVIDAGAWVGDFSAYCAKKGALVYAFEPTPSTIELLKKTISYNDADDFIKIAPYGLSDKNGFANFSDQSLGSANRIDSHGSIKINLITLDNWAKENNIQKIDFIKADIEGAERELLRGAKEVLKKFAPTLSICTYHLPDDPFVLEKIILEANPNYKIIQRKMKLFAYIKSNK
ncbi:MAG: FkbM family methyltransferase [Patescibacteria group bacterium]